MAAFQQTNAPATLEIPTTGGSAKQQRQSKVYQLDTAVLGRPGGFGIISGCQVTAQTSPNMTVTVAAGYAESEGVRFTIPATTITIATADATNPRVDVIVVNSSGTPVVRTGTPAATPDTATVSMGDVVLARIDVGNNQTSILSTDITSLTVQRDFNFSTEPTLAGLQDFFRTHAKEMQHFFSILGGRPVRPANVAFAAADSVAEGYGVTDDSQKFMWQWRAGMQQDYRDGGVGYIPARHGVSWLYSSNPDGNNAWALTSLVDQVYYGFGLGDRTAWLGTTNGSTATITVYGDVAYIFYTSGSTNTLQVDVDLGTAFAATTTVNTASTGFGMSGRIFKVSLGTLGYHTVKVTSITASGSVFLDGIAVFATDETVGVHMWDGAHSGYFAQDFDPTVDVGGGRTAGAGSWWPELWWQPTNETTFVTAGTGHGTNVLDVTGGGFTANDVGEYILGAGGTTAPSVPYGTKITGVNSATQVVVDKVVANVGSLSLKMNRASFADGKTNVGSTTAANGNTTVNSTTISSASNPFSEASVGATVSGTGLPAGGVVITGFVSASTVVVGQPAISTQTTSVFTITASPGLYSPTAAFQPWDEGKKVKGTNIPAGTYIQRYVSATNVIMSANATGTGTAQTFQINNRTKYPVQPDLLVIELALNDMKYSYPSATFKQAIINIVNHAISRGGLDWTPSVMILGMWATSLTFQWQDITATSSNGSAVIAGTNGDYGFYDKDGTLQTDLVGKAVTGTNVPGGATVASVQTPFQLTLSANCTGNVAGSFVVTSRVTQDFMWQRFRTAMAQLCTEQGWFFKDLYTLYGYIGGGFAGPQVPLPIASSSADPNNFTNDDIHPNNRCSRTIGDQLAHEIGGKSLTGLVSRGMGNGKGDTIYWQAADLPQVFPAQQAGQTLHYAPNALLGVRACDPMMKTRLIQQVDANPTLLTVNAFGSVTTAPTITADAATTNVDDDFCARISLNTTAVSGHASKILSAFTLVRRAWMPEVTFEIKTPATITLVRYWIGLFSADPSGSAAPATTSLAAFRYDTGASDTSWAVCTSNNGTQTAKLTGIAIAASTLYELAVVARGANGSAPTGYDFWINDVWAGNLTTNLPATGLILGAGATVTTLSAAARSLEFSRYTVSCL